MTGSQQKQQILDLFEYTRPVQLLIVRRAFAQACIDTKERHLTIDAIHDIIDLAAITCDRRMIGSFWMTLDFIKANGRINSRHNDKHAQSQTRWRILSKRDAKRWLASHPLPEGIEMPFRKATPSLACVAAPVAAPVGADVITAPMIENVPASEPGPSGIEPIPTRAA